MLCGYVKKLADCPSKRVEILVNPSVYPYVAKLINHALLLSERRCSANIYPHQWYHQVINTTLVTIVMGEMPDYPWIGRGEPTHGGGESSLY